MLEQAIFQTGATITDLYEDKLFKDPKLLWRNPLLLKVKLPYGKRWEFILASKCIVWLAKPPKLGVPKPQAEMSGAILQHITPDTATHRPYFCEAIMTI